MTPREEQLLIETLLRIPDKEGRDVDFKLNHDQAIYCQAQTGRDIIAKYRQGGFSTFPLGRAFVRCMAMRNRRHVILAHNTDTTMKLLERIKYMMKHIKCAPPDMRYASANRLTFNKTDSSIFIGTAGSDNYGVGDTITDLHASEVSRWPNPTALLTGLFQAVPPTGNILLESTGYGQGNWFHQAVMRAAGSGRGYKLHFFNWLNTPEYTIKLGEEDAADLMANLDETLDEPRYAAAGLTPGQIAWRRLKLEELNYDTRAFMENYPLTLDECFQATGHGLFPNVNFQKTDQWKSLDPWTAVLGEHPMPGREYIFGIDVAGGVGKDYSVIQGLDIETGEQVLEFRNNIIEPDRFTERVLRLAKQWNNAYLVPERNNQGILVVKMLTSSGYPKGLIYQPGRLGRAQGTTVELSDLNAYGIYTTETLKALMVGELQGTIRGELTIHSEVTRLELASFIETDSGRLEAEVGCHDDCVMALVLANYARPRAFRRATALRRDRAAQPNPVIPGTFDAGNAIDELVARYNSGGSPITSGVWDGVSF